MFALGAIWKDPGLVVSVVAFLSSFGPTCSAYRTDLRFCIRCEIQTTPPSWVHRSYLALWIGSLDPAGPEESENIFFLVQLIKSLGGSGAVG